MGCASARWLRWNEASLHTGERGGRCSGISLAYFALALPSPFSDDIPTLCSCAIPYRIALAFSAILSSPDGGVRCSGCAGAYGSKPPAAKRRCCWPFIVEAFARDEDRGGTEEAVGLCVGKTGRWDSYAFTRSNSSPSSLRRREALFGCESECADPPKRCRPEGCSLEGRA